MAFIIDKKNYEDFDIKWSQKDTKLELQCIYGTYYFIMPEKWKIDSVSENKLRLVEILIFYHLWKDSDLKREIDDLDNDYDIIRSEDVSDISDIELKNPSLDMIGISFSGGVDSSACVPILPKNSIMVYLKREWDSKYNKLKHKPHLECMAKIQKEWGREAIIIPSNIELIYKHVSGRLGYPSEYGCTIPIILLSDMYNIKFICTGTIGLYMKGGYKYHNFVETQYYTYWTSLFEKTGLELFWPVGGCSDRVTHTICSKAGINAQSCVRSDDGACYNCFKCFRKNYIITDNKSNTIISKPRNVYSNPKNLNKSKPPINNNTNSKQINIDKNKPANLPQHKPTISKPLNLAQNKPTSAVLNTSSNNTNLITNKSTQKKQSKKKLIDNKTIGKKSCIIRIGFKRFHKPILKKPYTRIIKLGKSKYNNNQPKKNNQASEPIKPAAIPKTDNLVSKNINVSLTKVNVVGTMRRNVNITPEIYSKLKKKPITRIMCRKLGLINDSDVVPYMNLDISFEYFYNLELTKQLVPVEFRDYVIEQLNKYVKPMNAKHLETLSNLDLSALILP